MSSNAQITKNNMNTFLTRTKALLGAMVIGITTLGVTTAQAVPVSFSTTAGSVFASSGTNVITSNGVTVTFNGAANSVNTPAGSSFGDIVVTANVGTAATPFSTGFTLNFTQTVPTANVGSLASSLSGNLGFNSGIATLSFSTTSLLLGDVRYTVNPSYTIALPTTGTGGGATAGTTSIQGTVQSVPDGGMTIAFLGAALGVLGIMRRKFSV